MNRVSFTQLDQKQFDLLVIGGGITGTAIARDAALRGLSVVLVEKGDFASGTSSRSSKLIHGGLKYLETYQFKLVTESVRERELALKLAPHLTQLKPFLYLIYEDDPESRLLLNLGLTFYDVVSGSWRERRHKMLNKEQVLQREPHVRAEGLLGGGLFYDVLTDDARFTIDMAKSATEHGAILINHAEVTDLCYSNEEMQENKQCIGVTVKNTLTQEQTDIYAHAIVNATGPWSDAIRCLENQKPSKVIKPTKGVHIVVKKSDFPLNTALFMRSPDDNRVVWPIPSMHDDLVYIGTTDSDYDGDLNAVYPEPEDIRYLLNVANHALPDSKLTEEHIVGSWAGLRPLVV